MNASGLLRKLGPTENQEPDLLTLSRADEKDEYESQAKVRKLQPRKNVQAEIFPASRDFR
ncbi:hypothetical protein D3C86_2049590 [compost metagenome]